jgi:hypothetical protein
MQIQDNVSNCRNYHQWSLDGRRTQHIKSTNLGIGNELEQHKPKTILNKLKKGLSNKQTMQIAFYVFFEAKS